MRRTEEQIKAELLAEAQAAIEELVSWERAADFMKWRWGDASPWWDARDDAPVWPELCEEEMHAQENGTRAEAAY